MIESKAAAGLLAVNIVFVVSVSAMEEGDFKPPNLEGFTLYDESQTDGDGDGVTETQVRRYADFSRRRFFSMQTQRHTWAWSLDSGGDAEDQTHHYLILDTDCDGRFDQRMGLDEEFPVPDCLQQR